MLIEHIIRQRFIYSILFAFFLSFLFWDSKKKGFNYSFKKNVIGVDLIFCLITAVAASTQFSLFPLESRMHATDSSVFMYIGRMMHKGFIPYKDLFDHKGPFLYFIQYLGILFSPEKYYGIWFIEVFSMFVSIWFLLKIARLFSKEHIICYFSVLSCILVCGYFVFDGGNLTEEYALPCISIALYIFLKYFINKKLIWCDILISGICMSIVLMLRMNMIAIWIVCLPIILLYLIVNKQWKDIFLCVTYFTVGMLVVILPIIVYSLVTNSTDDMINCYLLFNFNYSDSQGTIANQIFSIVYLLKLVWPLTLATIISLINIRKKKLYMLNVVLFLVTIYLATMSGRPYAHYIIVLLPMGIIPFVNIYKNAYIVLSRLIVKIIHIDAKKNFVNQYAIIFACVLLSVVFCSQTPMIHQIHGENKELTNYLKCKTKLSDDVLILGNNVRFNITCNRFTKNKFFYQMPPITISQDNYKLFMKGMKKNPPNVIVCIGDKKEHLKLKDNMGELYLFLNNEYKKNNCKYEKYEDFYIYRY